jgi:ABC-type dipeptide/oligopeptide/nickel transport system permease component
VIRFAFKRLIQGLITLLVMLFLVFFLAENTGDPVRYYVNEDASLEDMERMRVQMGLDKPFVVRYFLFLGRAAKGDLGRSFAQHKQEVTTIILRRLPVSAKLAVVVFSIILVTAIPLGVLSAVKHGTWMDTLGKTVAILGQSTPQFWLGIMLILIFGVQLGLLPFLGLDTPAHYVLPGITGAWFGMAGLLRLTRSSMLEVLHSDYVRTARAKGLSETVVVWLHTFRNALIPIVTYAALLLAGMLNGFLLVEVIFGIPGLGSATVDAAISRDNPTLFGLVMYITVLFMFVNFLVDMLYGFVDPRIRVG